MKIQNILTPSTIAIVAVMCILNGIPIHINADWDEFNENVEAEWEQINPNGNKDYTYSFHCLFQYNLRTLVMWHLVYIGESNDEYLFIGNSWVNLSLNSTQSALIGRNGLIKADRFAFDNVGWLIPDNNGGWMKQDILDINERKRFAHPHNEFYDLSIFAIKDIDMTDSRPITTGPYPQEGSDLEMYAFHWERHVTDLVIDGIFLEKEIVDNNGNIIDIFDAHQYPFGKRLCQAGRLEDARGLALDSCLGVGTYTTPIVDANTKELVAIYFGDEPVDEDNIFNRVAISVPIPKEIQGYSVEAKDKVATTWADIKKGILHK